jgi:hypothetical protein
MKNIIDILESTIFFGRKFTRKKLAEIQYTVSTFPHLSRRELGHTICEHLNWVTPLGVHKIQSCLSALEQMEKVGLCTLPAKEKQKRTTQKKIMWTDKTKARTDICCDLDLLLPINLQRVTQKDEINLWNEYVDRYHYLNYRNPIGNHLRYFIVSKRPRDEILGCMLFSATHVRALASRDNWIGWGSKDRTKRLNLILNQNRFLIFPWVKVHFLASKSLSIISKQIVLDWEEHYNYRPVLLETFVNSAMYKGTSYQAANWQYLGQTSGRNWKDNKEIYQKDIYVYPLTHDFRAVLKNEKPAKVKKSIQSKKASLESNDPFIALWQKVIDIVFEVAKEFDQKWQKRKRVISTIMLILFIFRLVFSKNKQGYQITIIELWEQCHNTSFPLPQYKPVAPSAFCEARKKLDENIFKDINREVIKAYENTYEYKWKGHRLFAVDGTKLNLPRGLMSYGYTMPSDTMNYPQGLVSCLYQLKSKIPYDFDIVSNFDERKIAINHLRSLVPNDVVVYDRGYFSYIMLNCHMQQRIHAVFRIQNNTYKVIDEFMRSNDTDKIVIIDPSKQRQEEIISKMPSIKIIPIELRLIKYTVSETTYIIGTTLLDKNTYSIHELSDVYHSRWGIEELYKISKNLIDVEEFHAQSDRGVKQELFAHLVLITMNRIFSNKIENGFISEDINSNKKNNSETYKQFKVNFKNSLITMARNLETLFVEHVKFVSKAIKQIFKSISICKQKERPNRNYERISMKPIKKWRPTKIKTATI